MTNVIDLRKYRPIPVDKERLTIDEDYMPLPILKLLDKYYWGEEE